MAVRTRDEIISAITARLGDDHSDEALAIIEDVTDTFDSMKPNGEDWKKKYEDNDKQWRQRYRDRFMNPDKQDDDLDDKGDEGSTKKLTFENLFKEG